MRFERSRLRDRTHTRLAVALIALVVALTGTSTASAGPPKKGSYGTRLGSHSMLYLNTAPAEQEAMFIAARDAGVRYLRMDITMAVTFGPSGIEDYTALRRVDALAARYGVTVLGVLTGPTWWLTDCPPGTTSDKLETCPLAAAHESDWTRMVAKTVRNAPHIRYWELFNEPNIAWLYDWTPDQYAHLATLTATAIEAARSDAKVVLGGASSLDREWISAVLHDADEPVIRVIDIANVHLRGRASEIYPATRDARRYFASLGFRGPLWVTETGYPSLPAHQWDPAYDDGDAAQMAYIQRLVPDMIRGGADAMFLAFRDGPEFGQSSPFASEGIVRWPTIVDGRALYKPAFATIVALAAGKLPSPVNHSARPLPSTSPGTRPGPAGRAPDSEGSTKPWAVQPQPVVLPQLEHV